MDVHASKYIPHVHTPAGGPTTESLHHGIFINVTYEGQWRKCVFRGLECSLPGL